jgi:hypothetical protein
MSTENVQQDIAQTQEVKAETTVELQAITEEVKEEVKEETKDELADKIKSISAQVKQCMDVAQSIPALVHQVMIQVEKQIKVDKKATVLKILESVECSEDVRTKLDELLKTEFIDHLIDSFITVSKASHDLQQSAEKVINASKACCTIQ